MMRRSVHLSRLVLVCKHARLSHQVQKSGVLRRTVDYIRQLQSVNQRLEEENSTLKTILKRLNLTSMLALSNQARP